VEDHWIMLVILQRYQLVQQPIYAQDIMNFDAQLRQAKLAHQKHSHQPARPFISSYPTGLTVVSMLMGVYCLLQVQWPMYTIVYNRLFCCISEKATSQRRHQRLA